MREHFAAAPVDAFFLGDGLEAVVPSCGRRSCGCVNPSGHAGGGAGDVLERLLVDARAGAPVVALAGSLVKLAHGPWTGGGVSEGLKFWAYSSAASQLPFDVVRSSASCSAWSIDAGLDEALGVKLRAPSDGRRSRAAITGWVTEASSSLVVAPAAIADQIDDHVRLEMLAEFHRQARRMHDGFGIVAVDVEHRGLDRLGDVGGIAREAAVAGIGRKADLVVDDDVDGPAGAVGFQFATGRASRRRCPAR